MDPLTALSTIAAIAVTLTGFAGLLAAFRRTDTWQPVELFAVRYLVLTSASGCLLALLPIPMSIGGYPEVWRGCLLILGGWLLFVVLWTLLETFRSRTRPRRPVRFVITQTAGLLLAPVGRRGGPRSRRLRRCGGIRLGAALVYRNFDLAADNPDHARPCTGRP
jgi:hypothetical protein